MPPISDRLQAVQTPIIPVIGELIREHPGTISLGQGIVGYGPPPVQDRLTEFLADADNHKYKLVRGIAPLLEIIEAKLTAENGIPAGPDGPSHVVVTAGGNMAFMNAVLAVTDPGDDVILNGPFYFNHEMAVTIAGATPVIVDCDDAHQLRPDALADAIGPRTRAIVTISPNNPTGAVYPESALRAVNKLCRARGIWHVHDEAYEYFTYGDARHVSPGAFDGAAAHTISLFSLSKSYGFASWRIGYMTIPETLLDPVKKIQDTNLICPPAVSQHAALAALEAGAEYCREKLPAIAAVRAIVQDELAGVGCLDVPPAEGAFYFLPRVDTTLNAMDLARRLIAEHGVAVIPATAFGVHDDCRIRVAYGVLDKDTAAEALRRLVKGLNALT